jgi:hypothetical protein
MIDFEGNGSETPDASLATSGVSLAEQQGIPRFEWEHPKLGKFWVEFEDPQLMSGKHVSMLRTALGSSENAGTATNAFMGLACQLLIAAWEIPTAKGGLQLPRYDKTGQHKWLSSVPGGFLVKLELHMGPYLEFLTKAGAKKKEQEIAEGEPGSPLLPESA